MKKLLIIVAVVIGVWFFLPMLFPLLPWYIQLAIISTIFYFLYKGYLFLGGSPINFKFWKKSPKIQENDNIDIAKLTKDIPEKLKDFNIPQNLSDRQKDSLNKVFKALEKID
jgi:hypothetical protein